MRKLFVTGANGQLGRAVNSFYKEKTNVEIFNTGRVEMENITALDITDVDAVLKLVEEIKPYAIINCAAHTAVDKGETDGDNAYKINAIGPRNLSIAARSVGAKMVHISTDYVFGGDGNSPYTEFDSVNPQGIYGKTKLAGENFVRELADRYFIVRTAWLYGDGNNFVKTMLRLGESNKELNVVCDQVGSPTSTGVLADIIDKLVWTDNYGTFHGTCEGMCSWADFAEEIFKLAGKNVKVNHISSERYQQMFPQSAKRPAYSVLENYMLKLTTGYVADDWLSALKTYMKNI